VNHVNNDSYLAPKGGEPPLGSNKSVGEATAPAPLTKEAKALGDPLASEGALAHLAIIFCQP